MAVKKKLINTFLSSFFLRNNTILHYGFVEPVEICHEVFSQRISIQTEADGSLRYLGNWIKEGRIGMPFYLRFIEITIFICYRVVFFMTSRISPEYFNYDPNGILL